MAGSDDIRKMSDPDFLAERSRVRETIETLQARMAVLDDEFTRRAGTAWTEAAQTSRVVRPIIRTSPGGGIAVVERGGERRR
jgi:hypothetical protein